MITTIVAVVVMLTIPACTIYLGCVIRRCTKDITEAVYDAVVESRPMWVHDMTYDITTTIRDSR